LNISIPPPSEPSFFTAQAVCSHINFVDPSKKMDGEQLRGFSSQQLLQLILQCVSVLIQRYNVGWLVDDAHDFEFVQEQRQQPQAQDQRGQHEPTGGPSMFDPHHDQKEPPEEELCSGYFSAGIKNKKDHHDRHAEDMRQKTWQQPQYVSYAASSSSVAPGGTTTTTFNGNSAGTTTQQLLTPFRCPYECKYCPKCCSRSKPGHGGHSCYEHRHRRD